jgi:hypothetical protein
MGEGSPQTGTDYADFRREITTKEAKAAEKETGFGESAAATLPPARAIP